MIARLDGTEQAIYKSAAVAPAQYMRLARVGDDWTVWFSADGDAWTEIAAFQPGLAPTEMGVFGSNTGSAFDAKVDYFIDLSDPLEDTDTAP